MRYPMINKQPRREVNIPQLSGGLNLRDSLTGVRDNQMTDCVNMWYKEGMLRTRPGFVTNEDMMSSLSVEYDDVYITNVQSHTMVKNGEGVLVSGIKCDGSYKTGEWFDKIVFFWQYVDRVIYAGHIDINQLYKQVCYNDEELEAAVRKYSHMIFSKDGYIYLFLKDGSYENKIYKSSISDVLSWEGIAWHEYYVPTVYAHCLSTNNGADFIGTQFEPYNSLCDSYKMVYSLYNPNDTKHNMAYKLAGPFNFNDGYVIEATIIGKNGEEDKYIVEKNSYDKIKHSVKQDKNDKIMTVYLDEEYQYIMFSSNGDYQNNLIELTEKDNYAEDNLIITISPFHPISGLGRKKIFNMTQSIWFGGVANGINSGSRLFLCGNTDESEKSLVVWSALNNPLYFPENNYAYVGDKSQGVTAFGQQGENLIIFKEKSTYYSYYATNDNITADDIINQSVVDYEANSVYFPMIQINANIGCDCPDTVQLCRNRLVWANSDGSVYTLYSNNQYNERTIYKVSDMIGSALKRENDLKNAVSCDFEGHYLLCVGNRIYVMDYNSYGYQYASSFSKNEDSNAQIPWYIWEYNSNKYGGKIFELNNKLMIMNSFKKNDAVTLTFSVISADEDNANDKVLYYDTTVEKPVIVENGINSKLQTKMFDFSAAGYLKNVDRVSVGFGNNGGAPIDVSFVTDKGSYSESVELVSSDIDERDAAFVSVKSFRPSARAVRTFGVKIECEGPLIINGLALQYRLLGGVK